MLNRRKASKWIITFLLLALLLTGLANNRTGEHSTGASTHGAPLEVPTPEEPPVLAAGAEIYLPLVIRASRVYLPLLYRHLNIFARSFPENGTDNQSPNTWLEWAVIDDAQITPPLRYTIFLQGNNSAFDAPYVENLDKTNIDPYTFEPDTKYYWKVIATDASGVQFGSPIWSFRTEPSILAPDVSQMATIPAGFFMMGCDASTSRWHPCMEREFPLRQVWIDAFEIDKFEVTNGEYRACADAQVCSPPAQYRSNKRRSYFDGAEYQEYPVIYVSHADAETYCTWEGKRLPTEAEWEKAARGPHDTREWPWGPEYPDCTRANFSDNIAGGGGNCIDDTDRVGNWIRGASPYGVMDMAGNVFEWVHDRYDIFYYQYAPDVNPQGPIASHTGGYLWPDSITYYTIRGGSFRAHWYYTRTTHRHWGHKGPQGTSTDDIPYFRNNFVGFRCARSTP